MAIVLRDYQEDALAATGDHIARGARRLVLSLPTGAGKTVIFASLSAKLGLLPSEKILILAHRDELVQQAVDKYLAVNPLELVGVEKASERATPMHRVVVASVQTLKGARLAEFLARWGIPALVITDEAHHAVASGYQDIYNAVGITPSGETIHVGVTATPKRSDNVGLDGTFDAVAYSITIGDLIKRGHLVPLVGYRVETKVDLDAVKTLGGDFNQGQLAAAVDTAARNARVVAAYHEITPGRRAVVFAASVAHSQHLAEMFAHAGYTAAHVSGETPTEERRAMLADFSAGKYDVICNCAVLTEGWDEPPLEVALIARPTKSPVLYTQMIGRTTRTSEGKTKAAVIDFVDSTKKHSIISLPSLLGLPPTFNLGGRDATKAADAYAAVLLDDPLQAALITNAAMLAKLTNVSEAERMAVLVRHLMEQARETSSYVPVDMLVPPPMPDAFDPWTYMVWTPVGNDAYRLTLQGNESLTITGDMVGKYTVTLNRKRYEPETLGVHAHIQYAFSQAELWVRDFRGDELAYVDKRAAWRREPASNKQKTALQKFRVAGAATMTKHEANQALDAIMNGLAKGTHHAARRAS